MIVEVGDTVARGRAVTLGEQVDPATVARAVRERTATDDQRVTVRSQRPHPVYDRVGYIHPAMGLRVKTALAEAGRARGLSTPEDRGIRECRRELDEQCSPTVETVDQRQHLAETSTDTAALRERVAETRGRLSARRTVDAETAETVDRLQRAARELSEVETSAVAAEQRLQRKRSQAREAREVLDQRMRRQDELANRKRRARATLVERLTDAYRSAVAAVPGGPATLTDPFAVDPVTAGLAIARLAEFDAPVVLACDRFADADAASAWLAAPVVRVKRGDA